MHQENLDFGGAISQCRVPFAMVIYAILAFPYPLALTLYHLFLMGRGETTREYLNSHKFVKSERYRAFTHNNAFTNWLVALCRPRPPTYLRFKHGHELGDQRLGEVKTRSRAPAGTGRAGGGVGVEMQKMGEQSKEFNHTAARCR
jgi:palmitoyltransferase ZDHHC9/14/18